MPSNMKTKLMIGIILVLLAIIMSGCFDNQVEYKVVVLDTGDGSAEGFATSVEWQLNELGHEGWDCTVSLMPFSGVHAYCKR